MGQNPTVPVYRGEIQTRNLGMAVEAWNLDGRFVWSFRVVELLWNGILLPVCLSFEPKAYRAIIWLQSSKRSSINSTMIKKKKDLQAFSKSMGMSLNTFSIHMWIYLYVLYVLTWAIAKKLLTSLIVRVFRSLYTVLMPSPMLLVGFLFLHPWRKK